MERIRTAALIAARDCMAIKQDEEVLILTDGPLRKIGYALWEASKQMGAEAIITEIIPRRSNGEEPPPAVAELMKLVDVVLIPTSMSLSHTEARREASDKGVRIATLPGITEETMIRTLSADYNKIAERSRKIAGILHDGSSVRITTDRGTDITLSIDGRAGFADTGLNHNPGDFSNLPAGEGYISPAEGKSVGVIVFDGSMAGVGKLRDEVIKVEVIDGFASRIDGADGARQLLSIMKPLGKLAFNLAELGIGTNDKAQITGSVLEDEKAMGTVHIAFGDNKSMGGFVRVASHLDGVIMNPSVSVDGELILEGGRFVGL
jgi:leucyl aminopeptidase (aminopeptidase T)